MTETAKRFKQLSLNGLIQSHARREIPLRVDAKLRRWRRVAERTKWDLLFDFLRFHYRNEFIFDRFCEEALKFIAADYRMSHKDMLRNLCYQINREAVLSDEVITTEGVQRVKLNNGYHAFYVRLFEAKYPEHRGWFRTRKMRIGAGSKQWGIEK